MLISVHLIVYSCSDGIIGELLHAGSAWHRASSSGQMIEQHVELRTLAMHLAVRVAVALLSAVTACVHVLALQEQACWGSWVC